jgi:UDP:flavonoid glycosyltransferase YjiC (YdhE family)
VRLGWSGAGINLKTGRPTVDQLYAAVHAVLASKSYREQAQRMQQDIAQYHPLEEVSRHIDAVLTLRSVPFIEVSLNSRKRFVELQ